MATATTEPAVVRAGDTITWKTTLADYPAGVWTLKYRLLNAAGKIDITASADGTDHLVSVAAAASAAWGAGTYDFLAWVESGAARHSVGAGRIVVQPDMATLNSFDGRSPARKIHEGLLAAYESAVASRAFVAEYEIAGRKMKFNGKADWLTELNYWKAQVAAEDRAAAIAAGMGGGARVLVRF